MARARTAGRRADLRWTLGNAAFSAVGATSAASTIVIAGNTSQTIMRTRGSLVAWLNDTTAPGVHIRVGVGFLLAQSGVGTNVFSAPLDDGDAPFFWYETFSLAYEESVTDVIAVDGISSYRSEINSKAMRVLRPDQEVQCVVQQETVGSSGTINIGITARFLLAD